MVSQRKKIVKASASASEAKKDTSVLASIGEGVFSINKKFLVTTINTHALHFLHKRQSSCIGKPYWRFFRFVDEKGKPSPNILRKFFRSAFRKKTVRKTSSFIIPRLYVRIPRRGAVPVALSAALVEGKHGSILGGVVTFRDSSQETEIERLKTEFVSIASHQLSAPLAVIRWNIEMLLAGDAGPINDEQREYLTDVLQSNARMIRLVNDLLNVSRLEEGRIKVDPQPTNLRSIVDEVLNEYRYYISSRGCGVQVLLKNTVGDPVISVDPILYRQILNNLITNSIQYSTVGGCKILITLEKRRIDYKISVWDNGIGVPKKVHKKIFSKFFRADNAQQKEAIGTGLGLYITKLLVRVLGGKMGFQSDASGTTFYFTLPVKGSLRQIGEKSFSVLSGV